MKKNPVVWIVQDDGYKDFRQAEAYGNLKVLATRDLSLFADPSPRVHHLSKELSKYDPDVDYLLLAGDPILIGAVCGIVLKSHGTMRALKWSKQSQDYKSVEIKL